MGNTIFYCEIGHNNSNYWNDYYWEFPPGIYMIPSRIEYNTKISRCCRFSKRVWVQGPKGGVQLRPENSISYRYVTTNDELMKQFMWVKLQAQTLQGYN